MLYPDAQPQDKSSGNGKPAKPKPKPIPALPAVIYTSFGIQEADELRERIKKAEEYRERVREAARNSGKPKQNQKSQKTDPSRRVTRSKTTSYDPLSSIQAPRPKPAPAPAAPDNDKPKKKEPAQSTDANAPSPSGFPQDIEWQPDINPADIFDLCGRLCEENPEAMTSMMNFIEGFDPDDDEQTISRRVNNHLRIIGLNDAFDRGDWYTTPIDPSLSHSAAQIADYYFDRRRASQEERPATPTAEETLLPDQDQTLAEAVGFTAPEINYPTQYLLTETFPEWNPSWTRAEDFQKFLIPRQERFIDEFNATAVKRDDLTVQDTLMKYRLALIGELNKIWVEDQQITSRYEEIKDELGLVNELLLMAQPIPLDDTTAYIEAFTGTVWIPDAEHERKHVQDQLALIYEDILEVEPQHLETRSTVELKYELYYRLRHDVLPFLNLDENESQIPDFMRDYVEIARDVPEQVVSRLQGSYHRPDVAGFLFLLGLAMVFEPVDWALTVHDVLVDLSEGDVESAIGNAILGAAPIVSSKLDDVAQSLLNLTDNIPLLPARVGSTLLPRNRLRQLGFSDEMIDAIEFRGGTGPQSGIYTHRELRSIRSEDPLATATHSDSLGNIKQDENARVLQQQYEYNIINEPNREQLTKVGFYERTAINGDLIDSIRNPDYIIEGKIFDSYTVSRPEAGATENQLLNTVWRALYDKVPEQTNRLVIDLSYTPLTSERFITDLASYYAKGLPLDDAMLSNLEEIIFMKDGRIVNMWVRPLR